MPKSKLLHVITLAVALGAVNATKGSPANVSATANELSQFQSWLNMQESYLQQRQQSLGQQNTNINSDYDEYMEVIRTPTNEAGGPQTESVMLGSNFSSTISNFNETVRLQHDFCNQSVVRHHHGVF